MVRRHYNHSQLNNSIKKQYYRIIIILFLTTKVLFHNLVTKVNFEISFSKFTIHIRTV